MALPCFAQAFGLHWRSDIALPGFDPAPTGGDDAAAVDICRVDRLADRGAGRRVNCGWVHDDGIRFAWGQEVAFDMMRGRRIAYCPGEAWTGAMPASFYSTVAALTLAWRGTVPFHAGAVELDGRVVLIAGAAGAGKSTLTAELLAAGAGFVADDLSAIVRGEDGRIAVPRGRPTIRLHADTAALVDASHAAAIAGDPRGKWLVRPRRRSMADDLPLGAVVIVGDASGEAAGVTDLDRLLAHIFRRRWIAALSERTAIVRTALAVALQVPVLAYPSSSRFDPAARQRRTTEIMSLVRSAIVSGGKKHLPARPHPPATEG